MNVGVAVKLAVTVFAAVMSTVQFDPAAELQPVQLPNTDPCPATAVSVTLAPEANGWKQSLPQLIPVPVTVPKPVPPLATVRPNAPTSSVTVSLPLAPAPSLAVAVIVCVPAARSLARRLSDAPVCRAGRPGSTTT